MGYSINTKLLIVRLIIFLLLNFGALGIGQYFTGPAVSATWYQSLNLAPWTPPGWVFGAAWTTIMVCFSIYMAVLWGKLEKKKTLLGLYIFQLILNISWNPVFFHFQNVGLGIFVITSLSLCVFIFLFKYWTTLKSVSLLIIPYCIWILIATSLNMYVWVMN